MAVNPALQAYADKVNAAYDTMGNDVDSIVRSLSGIGGDVTFLKDTITKLQNSTGGVTPEDQTLIDTLEARITALQSTVASTKNVAAGLDAATEEAPPVPPAP